MRPSPAATKTKATLPNTWTPCTGLRTFPLFQATKQGTDSAVSDADAVLKRFWCTLQKNYSTRKSHETYFSLPGLYAMHSSQTIPTHAFLATATFPGSHIPLMLYPSTPMRDPRVQLTALASALQPHGREFGLCCFSRTQQYLSALPAAQLHACVRGSYRTEPTQGAT